jgi:Dehydrogenases with different specificities (related to short-chain alcohol dehydrogenases)
MQHSILLALLCSIFIHGTRIDAFSFVGKKVLVTGSSGGIGAAIAKELAKRGCRVMVHYNSRYGGALATKQSIVDSGGICDGLIQCDFRDPSNIHKMMQIIDGQWEGEIDILINNAGLITKLSAEDEDDQFSSWMDTIQVNLNAPYQLSKLAFDRMKRQKGGGNIINISSIHGTVSCEYMVAYAASKAALDRMTAGLSNEWARAGVRVNAVAPGIVPVERTEDVLKSKSSQDMWLPHLPVGRMGTVEECAHAVTFLCENEWTSGSVITLDGGMTARINMPFRPRPENSDGPTDANQRAKSGAYFEP